MIVAQVSELLFSHELFLLCLGETGLQASASEWEHEKDEGLVLGEWEDERLGISPGARGKLEEEEWRRSWAGECRGPRPQDPSPRALRRSPPCF